MSWDRYVHHIRTWGTVIVIDVRADNVDEQSVVTACADVQAELERIDAVYSTYRADSIVSKLRSGEVEVANCRSDVQEVVAACKRLRTSTDGAFDPWSAVGGFDPSGYVKGWGADRAAELLVARGFANVCVNAAGDVTCRGSADGEHPGWRIGVADPRDRTQVITSVLVQDAHLATSGRYEIGDHIVDPATSGPARAASSASVLAGDGGEADAWATALMVTGPRGLATLPEPAQALLVLPDRIWSRGPAFARSTGD